jgi:hypothetical protein
MAYQIFDPVSTNISKKQFKTKEAAQKRIDSMVKAGKTAASKYRIV